MPCVSSRVGSKGIARKAPRRDVDQMAAGHVVPGLAPRSRTLCVPVRRSCTATWAASSPPVCDLIVNNNRAAAGQDFRPEVVVFALRAVGLRQHLRRSPGGDTRCSPVGRLMVAKIIIVLSGADVAPRGNAVEAGERDRRAAGDGDLARSVVPSMNPTHRPSGETKGPPPHVGAARDRPRFEGIERPDEELRAAGPHVDDLRPVG